MIDNARKISVTLVSGEKVDALLIGIDPTSISHKHSIMMTLKLLININSTLM